MCNLVRFLLQSLLCCFFHYILIVCRFVKWVCISGSLCRTFYIFHYSFIIRQMSETVLTLLFCICTERKYCTCPCCIWILLFTYWFQYRRTGKWMLNYSWSICFMTWNQQQSLHQMESFQIWYFYRLNIRKYRQFNFHRNCFRVETLPFRNVFRKKKPRIEFIWTSVNLYHYL